MIESLALVAKELAKSIGEAVKEAAMSEISELPDKAGELTEVESLPDKVDLVSEDLGWGLVSDVEADDDDVPDNHSAENIDPRLKDLPHPNIPDKDWPPHAHKRVFDEMFKHIDAIKRTNGNQDVPVESKVDENEQSNESSADQKETRELTDEERQQLKEQLGWTDKQLDKCTIDDDGVIHYRTDREDMEGKTAENGVRYERKTVDIHGVKVEGVFPVFDSAFDVQLPEELEQASNAKQFKECNEQLKEAVENNPDLKAQFTDDQLEDIANGDTPEGYVWHHNEETGKMQLVKVEDHDRTQGGAAHTGGKALWGGGYSTDTSTTAEGNKNNTSSEV